MTTHRPPTEVVTAVRSFNRFYTHKIGVLNERLLESSFTLTEVRVIFEIAHRPGVTASELVQELALDPGYMSRLVARLTARKLTRRKASASDARNQILTLTAEGRKVFDELNAASSTQVAGLIEHLPTPDQHRLVGLMRNVQTLMRSETDKNLDVVLREPRPGDYGWIVSRHGLYYAAEYGWNDEFEGLVAEIVANYIKQRDPAVEHCWIAELDGEAVGCIFLVRKSASVAQLRLLLVEPSARGRGIGQQLVASCIDFARSAGYQKIQLWTNSVLEKARRIYEQAGFELIKTEKHHSFGKDLVGQTWELRFARGGSNP